MTLDLIHKGSFVVVKSLSGGHDFLAKVAALGIYNGALLSVIKNSGKGPVLVSVHNTRVALGRGVAQKVLVEPKKS